MSNRKGTAEKYHVIEDKDKPKENQALITKKDKKVLYEQREEKIKDKARLDYEDFYTSAGAENIIRIEDKNDKQQFEVLTPTTFGGFPIQIGGLFNSKLLGDYRVEEIQNKDNGVFLIVTIQQPALKIDFSKINFSALSDRILVFPDKNKEVEKIGSIVVVSEKKNLPKGTVVSAGMGKPVFDVWGEFIHYIGTTLKAGDRVLFPENLTTNIVTVGDYDFIIMREEDAYLQIDIPEEEIKKRRINNNKPTKPDNLNIA